jgi:type I restriction enzyme S subunit
VAEGGRFPSVQIRRVARPGTGHTPSRSRPELWKPEACVVPWVTLADVWQLRAGTLDTIVETSERISEAGLANSAAVLHPQGTVILSRTASVGFSAIMGTDMAVSQDFMTWTPGPLLSSRFLLYVLRSRQSELRGLMYGSTHKTIYMPDLLALRTPLPELDTQSAIVDFLDCECHRIVALRNELLRLGDAALSPALNLARREFDEHPHGRIGYRFSVQLGKMLDEKRIDPGDTSPYLRNANVQWDVLRLDDLKRMTFDAADRRRFSLRPGDLLVCEGGEPGRCAVWDGEVEDCYYQKALNRVRPYHADSTRYLLWALRVLSDRGAFAVDGPGRYTHLTAEMLRAVRVPLPEPEVQHARAKAIDAAAAASRRLSDAAGTMLQRLDEYRDALITEAVTGQLDVHRTSEAEMDERLHAAAEGVPV